MVGAGFPALPPLRLILAGCTIFGLLHQGLGSASFLLIAYWSYRLICDKSHFKFCGELDSEIMIRSIRFSSYSSFFKLPAFLVCLFFCTASVPARWPSAMPAPPAPKAIAIMAFPTVRCRRHLRSHGLGLHAVARVPLRLGCRRLGCRRRKQRRATRMSAHPSHSHSFPVHMSRFCSSTVISIELTLCKSQSLQ